MIELFFTENFIKRYQEFLNSKEYKDIPNFSKSEYWDYHSELIDIKISGNKIKLTGCSGFYIPPLKKPTVLKISKRIIKVMKNPYLLISFLKEKIGMHANEISLLNYYDAFNKVLNHDPITDPDLSPHRINFKKLKEKNGILSSVNEIKSDYFGRKYKVNDQIVRAYYYFNILNGYMDLKGIHKILEIGAGNGNLISIIHHKVSNCNIIDVDLPETLSHCILFIKDLFPEARILMPNEARDKNFNNYDFIFLTPNQIDLIENDSIDLAINISSFQEMTHQQIQIYFDLIQSCCAHGSYFLCGNRVEKIPSGEAPFVKECQNPPNRFSEYPWNDANDILIYEICRFTRLVQLDNAFIRLEIFNKKNN